MTETPRSTDAASALDDRIENICIRFEDAWKAGHRPSLEEHLGEIPADGRDALLLELLRLDVCYRKQSGEVPTPEEYLPRFRGDQELLREAFADSGSSTRETLNEHAGADRADSAAGGDGRVRDTIPTGSNENVPVTPPVRAADDEVFPRFFGSYELRALLGRGGMGAVYLAHDPRLDRFVALKIPRLHGDDQFSWRERFRTEARAAATLHHPNICPVFEVGEADGRPYLTMAYIEGETLAARLRRAGRMPIPDAVGVVRIVARAMAEAHDRGVVHRDLKPANVLIDRRGQPVVTDFGLALRATTADDLRLTLSGVAMGTPAYMPPEQAGGDHDAIGPPADVYSLGVILYELVTGKVPFEGKSFGKLLAQIERDPPPPPATANPEIDPALEAIILRTLAKTPAERYATAKAFADALDTWTNGDREIAAIRPRCASDVETAPKNETRPVPRRRRIGMAISVLGISLLALIAILTQMPRGPKHSGAETEPHEILSRPAPKPVAYPEAPTLIEIPGYQVLTDATEEGMKKWLDDHKAAKHSVTWLDAVQVGERPVFTAIAALDDRAADWLALLDVTEEEINNSEVFMTKRLHGVLHVVTSISGFVKDQRSMSAVLLRPGAAQCIVGIVPLGNVERIASQTDRRGFAVHLIRPFPVDESQWWCALYAEAQPGRKSRFGMNLTGDDLARQLEQQRTDGRRPVAVVSYVESGEQRFAVTYRDDPSKAAWEVYRDLTAAELREKTVELAGRGFVPASLTACPWDGAVRYTGVWVGAKAVGSQ